METDSVVVNQKKHTSRCLACKKNVEFVVESEGIIKTKNGVERYALQGHCPDKNHKICTFVKNPNKIKKDEEKEEKKEKKEDEDILSKSL